MVSYLSDPMEATTDFSWQGAKAAHAVLLCEMERVPSNGKIWTEWIGSEGLIVRSMFLVGVLGQSHQSYGSVKATKQSMGSCSIFVLFV